MSKKKTALLVFPYASRIGHGAFHGQRLLEAFHVLSEWNIVFLTGRGFKDRVGKLPLFGEIIEAPVNFESIDTYKGNFGALKWGIKRLVLQFKLFTYIKTILTKKDISAVLFIDGDILSIYLFWLVNKRKYSGIGWVSDQMTDYGSINKNLMKRVYKNFSKEIVIKMINGMDSTILYSGEQINNLFLDTLGVSQKTKEKIISTHYGSDPKDLRVSKFLARREIGIPTREEIKVCLFFGLLREDKRPEIAINAMKYLSENWWILIAGKPYSYSEDEIKKMVADAGLSNRSKLLLEYIPEDEIKYIFSASDLLLLPHQEILTTGSSGVFCMSRSYRLPVVGLSNTRIGNQIENEGVGFVAIEDTPKGFADQIVTFQNLSGLKVQKLIENIDVSANKYSFEATAKDYIKALEISIAKN
jgi:glycosyltransferase involved in cell wall biosynthesis